MEVRKHSFDTRQRDGAHALWFTTTLPEATATVATTASKLVCDLKKVLCRSEKNVLSFLVLLMGNSIDFGMMALFKAVSLPKRTALSY